MNKRKAANAELQTGDNAELQTGENVEIQPVIDPPAEPSPVNQAQPAPRRRPQKEAPRPLVLDPEFVKSPERMQYALLLALLLRQRGTARFTARDMDHEDTDYNIVFARTRDGQGLEVTVVSSESGIIRSPEREREAEKWRNQQAEESLRTLTFQALPPAPSEPSTGHPAAEMYRLHGMDPIGAQPRPFVPPQIPPGANPGSGFAIPPVSQPSPTAGTAEVIELPKPTPSQPADGSAPYRFPFQVGDSPQSAGTGPMNLDVMQHRLLSQDQEVAAQEEAAIARQERGE